MLRLLKFLQFNYEYLGRPWSLEDTLDFLFGLTSLLLLLLLGWIDMHDADAIDQRDFRLQIEEETEI